VPNMDDHHDSSCLYCFDEACAARDEDMAYRLPDLLKQYSLEAAGMSFLRFYISTLLGPDLPFPSENGPLPQSHRILRPTCNNRPWHQRPHRTSPPVRDLLTA
jgi:hypothetical protein